MDLRDSFLAFVLWMIYREMNSFIKLRQQFLLSKSHTKLPQSRTVLITAIPDELSTEHDLRTFASFVPGGVDKVWMYRSTAGLNELFERRQEACEKLEDAISHLLARATNAWRKKLKLHKKMQHKKRRDVEVPQECEVEQPTPSLDLLNELVPFNRRPRHRIGTLGCVGEKVDSYDWCKVGIVWLGFLL